MVRLLLFCWPALLTAQTPDAVLDSIWSAYVDHFKDIAMDEMARSGVPASITLAQGILESRAGTSELAQRANNHFGIKCGKGWKGKNYYKNDDERNKKGEPVQSCFRAYASVVECFADHSEFIRNPEKQHRYGFLFELDKLDYKAWAQGLQDAGYSGVGYYAEKLVFFIERYHLDEYDRLALNGHVVVKRLAEVNGVKMLQARPGETLADIAALYNLPVEKLQACNEYAYAPDQPLPLGEWIYVQPKRDRWGGPQQFHEVDNEQNLFAISQRYGVRLDALRSLNGLYAGDEPGAGAQIRLRGKRAPRETPPVAPLDTTPTIHLSSDGDTADSTASEPLSSAGGFTIEMLPEEKLFEPVPVYWPAETDAGAPPETAAPPSILDLDRADPEPEIVIDMQSGETQTYHTVRKGDTLYSIARKYGVSTERLRRLNRLKDHVVKTGQTLRVH